MISRVCRKSQHRSHSGAGDEKAILDKTVTKKAESENVVAESVSDQPLLSEKTVVEEVQEEKMTIAKSTVANAAAEEKAHSNRTHMGTSQHGVDVNTQPEVLDHLRERMSKTDEFLHHGVRAREKQEVLEQLSRMQTQRRCRRMHQCQNSDDCVGNLCGSHGVC